MFGYVKVCKPELKVREYEEYKAVYCTLCRVIGKEYGQTSRALLNYDATFYILLCDCAESGEAPQYKKGRCRFNPAKICNIDSRVGSLEKGKDADILVFDGDPLAVANKPKMVFVDGKQVK